MMGDSNKEQLKCTRCNKYFSYERTLKRHFITCRNKDQKNICGVKCPDLQCKKSLTNKRLLHLHLEVDHGVKLQKEQKIFATIHDFKEWKLKLEDDDLCFYVLSTRKTIGQNKKIMYLNCHRTGHFQSRSTGVRKIKSQGTNKIGSTCPSSMIVTEKEDRTISVEFCSTHFGHNINKAIVKRNTDQEHGELLQIKNRLEAGLGISSYLIAGKSEVTEKEIAEMNETSNSFLQVLSGKRKLIEMHEENKKPVNRNIDRQKRFVNKKKKDDSFSGRIEINEKKSLKAGLLFGEVQNIHTSNDHTYQ